MRGAASRSFKRIPGYRFAHSRYLGAVMRRIFFLTLALVCAVAAPAMAQTYPSHTVTVVVPYPPGGSVDGVARILVQALNETLGQHFIVEEPRRRRIGNGRGERCCQGFA